MEAPSLKIALIRRITELRDESLLHRIWNLLAREEPSNGEIDTDDPMTLAREPVPAQINFSDLKQQQGYDLAAMDAHFRTLDRSLWADEDPIALLQAL
ncbi:MAG: hypothetical protein D6722_11480 [Bacteroidetes bacterium]|nr:MAG: hypothetical protein D6722_11480 [Bacteroidota bacterium]